MAREEKNEKANNGWGHVERQVAKWQIQTQVYWKLNKSGLKTPNKRQTCLMNNEKNKKQVLCLIRIKKRF